MAGIGIAIYAMAIRAPASPDIPQSVLAQFPTPAQRLAFHENALMKSRYLPVGPKVGFLGTVFFEPQSQGEPIGFIKVQIIEFQSSGRAEVRARSASSSALSGMPTQCVYHWSAARGIVPIPSRDQIADVFAADVQTGDVVAIVAVYKGPLVADKFRPLADSRDAYAVGQTWRDWHMVEVSDLASPHGLDYEFFTGSANYPVHIVTQYDISFTSVGLRFDPRTLVGEWAADSVRLFRLRAFEQTCRRADEYFRLCADDAKRCSQEEGPTSRDLHLHNERWFRAMSAAFVVLSERPSAATRQWAVDHRAAQRHDTAYITSTDGRNRQWNTPTTATTTR